MDDHEHTDAAWTGPDPATQEAFRREEEAYWRQRDALLGQYAGQWVAIVNGEVAASGDQMNKVAAEAYRRTGRGLMYVNLVGNEQVTFRVRPVRGYFDRAFAPAVPMLRLTVTDLDRVREAEASFLVDTGADITLLLASEAEAIQCWRHPAGSALVGGIAGEPEVRQLFNALVHVGSEQVIVTADFRSDLGEAILGRDVLNEFSLHISARRDLVELTAESD